MTDYKSWWEGLDTKQPKIKNKQKGTIVLMMLKTQIISLNNKKIIYIELTDLNITQEFRSCMYKEKSKGNIFKYSQNCLTNMDIMCLILLLYTRNLSWQTKIRNSLVDSKIYQCTNKTQQGLMGIYNYLIRCKE